jgi:hypothetical protein
MPIERFNRTVHTVSDLRRQRYKTEASYRESAKAMSRRTYRRKAGVELSTCLHSLEFISSIAEDHRVKYPDGSEHVIPAITTPNLAKLLQKLYQTVWRWIKSEMIPAPIITSLAWPSKPFFVFHVEEARALVEIIGEHEKTTRYFRKDHRDVVMRIEQRITEIRQSLGIQR